MSVKRLLLLVVALGSDETETYFGKTGLLHVTSCHKVHDDRTDLGCPCLLPICLIPKGTHCALH